MTTPIWDFIKKYAESKPARLHMPGHKGRNFIGCELYDITEISGADELYAPSGILQESERNASALYGSAYTAYSAEGSSQCVKAMIYLAVANRPAGTRPVILAARNAHKSFLYAAALCGAEIIWLYPDAAEYTRNTPPEYTRNGAPESVSSICSCPITPENLRRKLKELKLISKLPAAVYLTSPDYLGGLQDIAGLSQIAREYGALLLVDNAHGAYLKFLENSQHPLDLGADMCCDSAHKTLPVLTGGAYLHISKQALTRFPRNDLTGFPDVFPDDGGQTIKTAVGTQVKTAMEIFGSTSPSWLILASLDLCNLYLYQNYPARLREIISRIDALKSKLRGRGWNVLNSDPLRITIQGDADLIIQKLKSGGVEWEYSDPDFVIFMATPENTRDDFDKILNSLGENKNNNNYNYYNIKNIQSVMTPREALFAPRERIDIKKALGRICAAPIVSCPPAIPIAIAGEVISSDMIDLFLYYHIHEIEVIREI